MPERKRIANLVLFLCSIIVSLIVIEITLFALVKLDLISVREPLYFNRESVRFWSDINEDYGVWHQPSVSYRHRKSCFDVTYKTNSNGARDVERSHRSEAPRTIVLGDSFMEGYGLERHERLSDLLESETGTEHLNFGTSGGFGPLQYYLLYRTMAKQFDHDTVLIGLLPDNDFEDTDYEIGKKLYSQRYRPYLIGNYPDYTLEYFNKDVFLNNNLGFAGSVKSFLRDFTYTYNAMSYAYKRMRVSYSVRDESYSGYWDYSEEQLNMVEFALERLFEAAKGKKVILFTIPVYMDIVRYDSDGEPPLGGELRAFAGEHGIQYIDLLEYMHDHDSNWKKYYHSCDGHWSVYGASVAANILMGEIQ